MKTSIFTLGLFLVFAVNQAIAQNAVRFYITVTNWDGIPISGATVQSLKKGLISGKTNINGQFEIPLNYENDTLLICHIGYEPGKKVIIMANSDNPLQIKLAFCVPPSEIALKIYGRVTGSHNMPIEGATVISLKRHSISGTNEKGQFETGLFYMKDTLLVTHSGYQPLKKLITPNSKYPLDIKLKPVSSSGKL